MIVVVLHGLHAVSCPHSLRALVVFLIQRFVFQIVMKSLYGWQLGLCNFCLPVMKLYGNIPLANVSS